MTSNLHDWEPVAPGLFRVPVPGGWLYRFAAMGHTALTFVAQPVEPMEPRATGTEPKLPEPKPRLPVLHRILRCGCGAAIPAEQTECRACYERRERRDWRNDSGV